MEEYIDKARNIYIKAKKIEIGNGVSFGSDVKVAVNGIFQIGEFSRLGSDCEIAGNNIKIGRHLFNSSGLRVGGGGREYPSADLTIGDRCTIHNNFLNEEKASGVEWRTKLNTKKIIREEKEGPSMVGT